MNRYDSRVCLLDADVLECQVNGSDVDAESSSSGYDSSDMSSDEDVSPTTLSLPDVVSGFTTFRPVSSGPKPSPHGDCKSVMVFKSAEELQDSLALILEMPDMCDVTFLVGQTKAPVYGVKAILATRSRYLYQLVLRHQKQAMDIPKKKKTKKGRESHLSQRLLINVLDYQAEDFKTFVKFVHSGKARIHLCNVIGLLCSSVEFGFADLQAACMEFIHRCRGQGQSSVLLDCACNYQHKPTAQKLICQLSTEIR